jgi:hypothetical protein
MRIHLHSGRCVLALLILLLPVDARAMDLPHYDLDSLVYLSTDIVFADVSKDARGNFTATVTEALYGSLERGVELDALNPFLTFFRPLDDGQKIILFLDRRPHEYDLLNQDAANSHFAVPGSGVYLIDAYGHVHEYYQWNNPGPYVAQGYNFFGERQVPTKTYDLTLPTVQEVKERIAATLKSVIPIRNFLDQPTKLADLPALMKLLVARPRLPQTCGLERNDAIAVNIIEKIRSLNDPQLMLRIWHLGRETSSAVSFVRPNGNADKSTTAGRVRFLIQTVADKNRDLALRTASLQILLSLSAFHSAHKPGSSRFLPIDNDWLSSSADQILSTAKVIFNNPAEDADLRALCLRFLDLNDRGIIADIKRVYGQTRSPELQFAIEQAFLEVSDELYQSLHPSSGPVASIIRLAPEHACVHPPNNQIVFLARFYSTRAFNNRGSVVSSGRTILKNINSGQRFEIKNARSIGSSWSTLDGVLVFALDQLSDFPAGVYTLGMEYAHQFVYEVPTVGFVNDVPSIGHTITVAIIDSPGGKRLDIPIADKEYR